MSSSERFVPLDEERVSDAQRAPLNFVQPSMLPNPDSSDGSDDTITVNWRPVKHSCDPRKVGTDYANYIFSLSDEIMQEIKDYLVTPEHAEWLGAMIRLTRGARREILAEIVNTLSKLLFGHTLFDEDTTLAWARFISRLDEDDNEITGARCLGCTEWRLAHGDTSMTCKISILADPPAVPGKTKGQRIVEAIIHEMVHALMDKMVCAGLCSAEGCISNYMDALNPGGHGPGWLLVALAVEERMQEIIPGFSLIIPASVIANVQ